MTRNSIHILGKSKYFLSTTMSVTIPSEIPVCVYWCLYMKMNPEDVSVFNPCVLICLTCRDHRLLVSTGVSMSTG